MRAKNQQISVTVKVFGGIELAADIQVDDPMRGWSVTIAKGLKVHKLAGLIGVDLQTHTLIIVNGERAEQNRTLEEGDEVIFCRPVAGG